MTIITSTPWDFDRDFSDAELEEPITQAALWMELLWGAEEGFACVGIGQGGHYPEGQSYRFARFSEHYFDWPTERDECLATVLEASVNADVFACPLLRTSRSRKAGTALPGWCAWADCDGDWTEERGQAVLALGEVAEPWPHSLGLTVASGSGGRHVYLPLGALLEPDVVSEWNRRLAEMLDGDHKWDATAFLRPPGTWNHKARARGGASTPVIWEVP